MLKGYSGICLGLQIMQFVTKEELDQTECLMYVGSLMLTGLEILIREDLQVGMCLAYLEELSVG